MAASTGTGATRRGVSEYELSESEARFRTVFENAAVGMAIVAPDGRWLKINQKVSDIVGYAPQELLQLTFQDITHPDDLEIDLDLLQATIRGERQAYNIEKRYLHKDGSIVWANLTVGCHRSDDGEVVYFISVIEDISEKRRAMNALAASEARFRAVQQMAPDSFVILSSVRDDAGEIIDFVCEYANAAAERSAGKPLAGLLYSTFTMAPNLVSRLETYRHVVNTGEVARGEMQTEAEYDARWYRYSAMRLNDGLAISYSDFTDHMVAELKLRKSEARFRAVQQTMPDGFLIFSAIRNDAGVIEDFRCEYGNPAAARLLKIDAEAFDGHRMLELKPENVDIGLFGIYCDVVESGRTVQGEIQYPITAGGSVWFRYSVLKIDDGFAVSFSDVTARKTAELKLRESEARFRAVQQTTPDGFMVYQTVRDDTGKIADFIVDYANPAVERMLFDPEIGVVGQRMSSWMPHPLSVEIFERYVQVVETGETWQGETLYPSRIGDIWFRATAAKVGDGFAVSFADVTKEKRAEQHREMLVGELSHRVKNTLATVQTMASHTLREASDVEHFRDAFVGRLTAISRCHDLLVDAARHDADIAQLVRDQVMPYAALGDEQVRLSGPALVLSADAAHTFGLVLHELATNAAKYGALSTEGGRIDISWERLQNKAGLQAVVTWRETGGPPVAPPTRRGFGSILIEQSLVYTLGGEAEIEYRPEGLWARFRFTKRGGA